MTDIVYAGLLEDEIEAMVRAGNYSSRDELLEHALFVLRAANPQLRIEAAISLYRDGKITLSRAAEMADMELETFKERLAKAGVLIEIDESPIEVEKGAALIRQHRAT